MNDQQSGTQSDNKSFFLIHRKTLTDVGNQIIDGYGESKHVERSQLSQINFDAKDELANHQLTYSHFYSKFGPTSEVSNFPNQSCIVKSNMSGIKTTILAYGDRLDYDISSIDSKDVYATNDVNQISTFQFERHSNITAFVGMNLITIAPEVFVGSRLIYVEIDGMENLPAECFNHCSNLEYISLGTHLKTIPFGCFLRCTKLVYIELPKTCTRIEAIAFQDCTNLRMVDGIERVTYLGDDALRGTNVRYIEIGTGFNNQIDFVGSVTRSNVEAVYVNNVKSTGDAFVNSCTKMNTVIVGSNVGQVKVVAKNCERFKDIIFEGTTTGLIGTLVTGYSNLNYIHHTPMETIDSNYTQKMYNQLCGPTISMRYYSPPNYAIELDKTLLDNISRLEFLSVNTNNKIENVYIPNSVQNVRMRKGECENEADYMSTFYSKYNGPRVHYY